MKSVKSGGVFCLVRAFPKEQIAFYNFFAERGLLIDSTRHMLEIQAGGTFANFLAFLVDGGKGRGNYGGEGFVGETEDTQLLRHMNPHRCGNLQHPKRLMIGNGQKCIRGLLKR